MIQRPDLDRTLAALSDPVRRQVVELLRQRPHRAGELAAAARLTAPAMSKHLKILRSGRLIEGVGVEDDARIRLYRLRPEPFEGLAAWLDEVRAFWAGQLDAFRDHVARRAGDG